MLPLPALHIRCCCPTCLSHLVTCRLSWAPRTRRTRGRCAQGSGWGTRVPQRHMVPQHSEQLHGRWPPSVTHLAASPPALAGAARGAGAQADDDVLPAHQGPPLPQDCAGHTQPGGHLQKWVGQAQGQTGRRGAAGGMLTSQRWWPWLHWLHHPCSGSPCLVFTHPPPPPSAV